MEKSAKARVALVGVGGIGGAAHLPAIQSLDQQCELTAIVDVNQERLTQAGEDTGCSNLFESYEEMLQTERPDIVVLGTPPFIHEEQAIAGMEAGAWVYCEKPLTGSLHSADRIHEAEIRTGNWCVSVSQFRYAGGSQQIKSDLLAGRWGKPLIGTARTMWYRGAEYWDVPWRGKFDTEFAGANTTQAYHAVDLILWLMGEDWDTVSGLSETLARPIEVEDTAAAIIKFRSGAVATLLSTVLSHDPRTTVQVIAENATINLDTLYLPLLEEWSVHAVSADGNPAPVSDWAKEESEMTVNAHRAQLSALLDRWVERKKPELTVADARPTLEFLTALYKSAYESRPISRGEIGPGDIFYDAIDAGGIAERDNHSND